MQPNERFLHESKVFWANVRTISQRVGYTDRRDGTIKIPTIAEVECAYAALDLTYDHITTPQGLTTFGETLFEYFIYRAAVLAQVKELLMVADEAQALFDDLKDRLQPTCPLPANKQTGEKQTTAYMTGIVNMLIDESIGRTACDFDPQQLTTVTRGGVPLRMLSRRVDGAFPSAINPVAVWEIKEYYHTTTFGSRVADGVYESLLDGMELEELREHEGIDVKHYFIVDAYGTWWDKGRSYLCRMIDMMHMGYADEVLFGREVVDRLPALAAEWVTILAEAPPEAAAQPDEPSRAD